MAIFIGQLMRFMETDTYLVIGQKPRYCKGGSKIIMISFVVFVGLPVIAYTCMMGLGFGV